ncbi:hypothetical protein [Kitasatospora sp. CB01950]|uniref:hypothetical protein n=1 Tax=Kitasatospora sp. CB01950 TaxID=1703930 RepID=UPI0009405BFD|nr:hypothetical protein [Kitasatospora sp. CB01950]OKI99929.1 hypothetical protein AMK19_30925 [Kitasatospora sp. CB01950]
MSNKQTEQGTPEPERLSQRWALILSAAGGVGVIGFIAGGPIVGLGAVAATITLLHTVMA